MAVYLITGASGYIGSMLTDHLLENEPDCEVIAPVRDIQKAGERFADIWGHARPGRISEKEDGSEGKEKRGLSRLHLAESDLCSGRLFGNFCNVVSHIDYVIHCASVTSSREMVSHPTEVIQSIVNATQNILELARRCGAKSIVCLSSMEVYGGLECTDGHRAAEREAGAGRVDILSARSCYPMGKRMAENICYSYFKEYGVPVKIARLAQTFGRGVPPSDNRVFAQFARAVRSGEDIVLHTEGGSMGNYCGIDDVISGILTILKQGADGEAYNVVNEENTMTIRQMAQLVASQVAGGRIGIRMETLPVERSMYAADTGLRMSGEKLRNLGWKPKQNLAGMYREMLEDMEKRGGS